MDVGDPGPRNVDVVGRELVDNASRGVSRGEDIQGTGTFRNMGVSYLRLLKFLLLRGNWNRGIKIDRLEISLGDDFL